MKKQSINNGELPYVRDLSVDEVREHYPDATILVFRDGGMAVMENALNQKEE